MSDDTKRFEFFFSGECTRHSGFVSEYKRMRDSGASVDDFRFLIDKHNEPGTVFLNKENHNRRGKEDVVLNNIPTKEELDGFGEDTTCNRSISYGTLPYSDQTEFMLNGASDGLLYKNPGDKRARKLTSEMALELINTLLGKGEH